MNKPVDQSDAPDLSLEDLVLISFERLGYPQLSAIKVTVEGEDMLLSGRLNSFYLKQVAQSVAVKVPGVKSVKNQIEVI